MIQGKGAKGSEHWNSRFSIADCGIENPQSAIRNPQWDACPTPSIPVPNRILVVRLDRVGDVILSTPVPDALRQSYPQVFIAMLVRPACQEVVQGHPSVDSVIVYDKEQAHKSVPNTIRFALQLRALRFDTAIVLHPSHRSHWIPWLAQIPVRIGYARKGGWLLTHRMPHRKQEGRMHETLYTLELLKPLGISTTALRPRIAILPQAESRIVSILREASVDSTDRLVAIHPSASCVSKRWMPERFAQVADRLIIEEKVRICLVAGSEDARYAHAVAARMRFSVLNFAGRLRMSELAALLKRCRLLISNDSGPVHVAAAVGIPVVDIFGRNQSGLSPTRWGPWGEGHVILHKEVGCVRCLAHACDIGFLCLTSLSVDEVYQAARSVLHREH